ncbi:DMT family transporter [Dactylosporangium sp. AC04546]|uniref:DMT family transporter n=1 Tax=Dactylosporangium sp. AC04546 TaxID=2862460 RepID=UPI001EE03DD1|nr:DMT family transporter [Dactylosporangium sp. AC04546]WVK88818.1 DMT family transporter [Dactylosporangium sp. AC04546]
MTVVAVVAALGSAAAFAVGAALEQSEAKKVERAPPLDPRLLFRLAQRPRWLLAWVPEGIGTALQAVALTFGPLILVEPLLVTGLFLAIPLSAALNRRRVHARDYAVVALGGASLAAFLIAADPRPGVTEPSVKDWLGVALWAGPVLAACLAAAWCARNAVRAVLLGVASGLLYGIAASLLKALTEQLSTEPLAIFARGQTYALIVVGLAAVSLNQNAFQSSRIAVPLMAITIVDPAVGVVIGVTAFHEQIATDGPRVAVQVVAALSMIGAIWLASTIRSDIRQQQAEAG